MSAEDNRITLPECKKNGIMLEGVEFTLDTARVDRGGSCLVYHARQKEAAGQPRKVILKEFYPVHQDCGDWRGEDGSLHLPEDPDILFKQSRFEHSYEMFKTFFNEEEMNLYVVQAQRYFRDNGTVYMVVDYSSGRTLTEYMEGDHSLYEFFCLMKTLSSVLGKLHSKNYVHMDIKPANILCYDHGLVRLMDVDTVICRDDFARTDLRLPLSLSPGYAAPEVLALADTIDDPLDSRRLRRQFSQQGEKADQFGFGAMVCRCILGKSVKEFCEEARADEKQLIGDLETNHPDIPRKAFSAIVKMLRRMLEEKPGDRYLDMAAVEQSIDSLLPLLDPKEVRLKETFCPNPKPVIGREEKLAQLREMLLQQSSGRSRIVIITGIGGVGKSTLARAYGEKWAAEYDVMAEVSASGAEEAMRSVRFENYEADTDLSVKEQAARCRDKISAQCKKFRTLLIVNDYDVSEEPEFNIWWELGCDVILTSRHDWADSEKPTLHLSCADLSPEEAPGAAKAIFTRYYLQGAPAEQDKSRLEAILAKEEEPLLQLLWKIDYHPLTMKFLAKFMADIPGEELSPSQALQDLEGAFLEEDSLVEFRHQKDGGTFKKNAYGHLAEIFRQSLKKNRFHENDLKALGFMTLIPSSAGICAKRFQSWLGVEAVHLERLKDRGWLEYLPNRQDAMEQKDHTGVYVMPTILQQILRKEPELTVTCSDIQDYADRLEKELLSARKFFRKQAAALSLDMLKYVAEEASEDYVWLWVKQYRAHMVINDQQARVAAAEKILSLYDGLPSEKRSDQALTEEVSLVRLFAVMAKGSWKRVEDLDWHDMLPKDSLRAVAMKMAVRLETGRIHEAAQLAREALSCDWHGAGRTEKFSFWSIMCYMAIYAGERREAETYYRKMEKLYRDWLGIRKDARLDNSFFSVSCELCRMQLKEGAGNRLLSRITRLLAEAKETLGENHETVGKLYHLLADASVLKSDLKAAKEYRISGWHLTGAMFDRAEAMMQLSLDCAGQNREDAEKLRKESLRIFNLCAEAIHERRTVKSPEELGRLYYRLALEQIQKGCLNNGLGTLDRWLWLAYRLHGDGREMIAHAAAARDVYIRFGLDARAEKCCDLIRKRTAELLLSAVLLHRDRRPRFEPGSSWLEKWTKKNIGDPYGSIMELAETNKVQKIVWPQK